jgi:hypothetical protein
LLHEGQRILLPEGETLIGRGLSCRVRFNDPTVSREHLRLTVSEGRAVVENVSSTGTLINGERLIGSRMLGDDDQLQLGYRAITVAVVDETTGPVRARRHSSEDGMLVNVTDEETRPGGAGWLGAAGSRLPTVPEAPLLASSDEATGPIAMGTGEPPARAQVGMPKLARGSEADDRRVTPSRLPAISVHACPGCRATVAFDDPECATCGYRWPAGHPSHKTVKISLEALKPRKEARYRVEVPVIYSSSTLTIDAIVRDISRGGMFIASEVLDPVGTPCELTALPDGHPAMTFSGVVAHVSDALSVARVSGLGIRIVGGSVEALRWLENTLARFSEAIVDE